MLSILSKLNLAISVCSSHILLNVIFLPLFPCNTSIPSIIPPWSLLLSDFLTSFNTPPAGSAQHNASFTDGKISLHLWSQPLTVTGCNKRERGSIRSNVYPYLTKLKTLRTLGNKTNAIHMMRTDNGLKKTQSINTQNKLINKRTTGVQINQTMNNQCN